MTPTSNECMDACRPALCCDDINFCFGNVTPDVDVCLKYKDAGCSDAWEELLSAWEELQSAPGEGGGDDNVTLDRK